MKKRLLALIVAMLTALTCMLGLGCGNDDEANTPADPVTIKIAGGWQDCVAVNEIGRLFKEKYPNVTVEYVYLQNYYASLIKRMSGTEMIDLFFTSNLQPSDPNGLLPFAADLNTLDGIDFSQTFKGLLDNSAYIDDTSKMYTISVGAEMRGLFVNKTLLRSCGISAVPTNQTELLAACATLKSNGYIPFHGNPGTFSQWLLYPWVCNLIANASDYTATYNKVNNREEGISELFRPVMEFLYNGLVVNDYYDYKSAQDIPFDANGKGWYQDSADEDYARYFFNLKKNTDGSLTKIDDIGKVAFAPATLSQKEVYAEYKDDYHSNIEYEFIAAPVSPNGGFAYLSPSSALGVNKTSGKTEWIVKFLNFLFTPENNEVFCEAFNAIPNTKEAKAYLSNTFSVPATSVSELGQVTFTYTFYEYIKKVMVDASKANNPKYFNPPNTGTIQPLSYWMTKLENDLRTRTD